MGEMRKASRILAGQCEEKTPLGRNEPRVDDNTKTVLKK
jgi:hypothetical protein